MNIFIYFIYWKEKNIVNWNMFIMTSGLFLQQDNHNSILKEILYIIGVKVIHSFVSVFSLNIALPTLSMLLSVFQKYCF